MDAFGAGLQPCSAYLWSFHLLVKSVLQFPISAPKQHKFSPFAASHFSPCLPFSQPQHHQRHKRCALALSTHPMLKGTAGITRNKSLIGSPLWIEGSGFAAEQPAGTGQRCSTPGTTKRAPGWILPYSSKQKRVRAIQERMSDPHFDDHPPPICMFFFCKNSLLCANTCIESYLGQHPVPSSVLVHCLHLPLNLPPHVLLQDGMSCHRVLISVVMAILAIINKMT